MTTINSYLSFNGNCEEAFTFYKSVFGGEFAYLGRYKDMPAADKPIPDSEKEKIMHVSLPISKETMLFGADSSEMFGQKTKFGDNISLSVNTESETEAKRIFDALSVGGHIVMPLEKTFWGALFGMFADKFGVCWMVNYDYNQDVKK